MKDLSATALIEKIKNKEFSSTEVTQYFINQIETVNPAINAVVVKQYEQALAAAKIADEQIAKGKATGLLHGLPFTIKECFDLPGTPSTFGLLNRKDDIPSITDVYIKRMQEEGGFVLGKTNASQLLLFIESDNRVYGKTKNPHNPAFGPGGSSGGEGAIISAGGSPIGIGTDIGGSVRFPAAFCGICSLKPSLGRAEDLTRYSDYLPDLSIKSVIGPMAKKVEDLELFLKIINQQAMNDRPSTPPLGVVDKIDIRKLKVGYYLSDHLFEPMPAVKRAVQETINLLSDMGVTMIPWQPPSLLEAEALFMKIMGAFPPEVYQNNLGKEKPMPQIKDTLMAAQMSDFTRSVITKILGSFGQSTMKRLLKHLDHKETTPLKIIEQQATNYRQQFAHAMTTAPNGPIDAILSPVCALPAFLHGSSKLLSLGGTYTLLHNLLGTPAGVINVSKVKPDEAIGRKAGIDLVMRTAAKAEKNSAGMPLAVQIAAPMWREDTILALMKKIEFGLSGKQL